MIVDIPMNYKKTKSYAIWSLIYNVSQRKRNYLLRKPDTFFGLIIDTILKLINKPKRGPFKNGTLGV
jgi:hypothetical protein